MTLSQILNGRSRMTTETAIRLEKGIASPPYFPNRPFLLRVLSLQRSLEPS